MNLIRQYYKGESFGIPSQEKIGLPDWNALAVSKAFQFSPNPRGAGQTGSAPSAPDKPRNYG